MNSDKQYFLSRGFDERTATYFASGRRRITQVVPNDDFTLTFTFDNHEQRVFNAKEFIRAGTVFEPLMDINHFKQVYLDENAVVSWDIDPLVDSAVHWDNKLDISPDTCYLDSNPSTSSK